MVFAEGARAQLTEGFSLCTTDVTLMPRTLPPTCRSLGEVETVCVVDFGTSRFFTGHHLSPVSTAEAFILSLFRHHRFTLPSTATPQLTPFVFGRWVVLWSDSEEAAAVWSSTFTDSLPVSQTLQVIVESQLCACWDVFKREQPDPGVSADGPLLGLAVRLTAVIHEARLVPLWTRVDDTVLVQCEHVEVPDVVFLSVFDSGSTLLFIDYLPHVLAHKLTLLDVVDAAQTPASRQSPEDLHLTVLPLREGLVLTLLPRRTHLRVTLVQQHAVDALGVVPTRTVIGGFTVTSRDLREVSREDLHFTDRTVHLDVFVWRRFAVVLSIFLKLTKLLFGLKLPKPLSCLLQSFLISSVDSFAHLLFAVGVHVHIREDSGLVRPQVVVRPEKVNRELPHVVSHSLDVLRDGFRMTDFRRPPPVAAHFDPEDVLVSRFLPGFTVVTKPASFRHLNVQTLSVKGRGTGLTAQQTAPFSADEAPAHIDVLVVLDSASGAEVVSTDDAVVGEDHAAGR